MSLAHHIPMAGHMGQRKTVEWILQWFYWPTVFEDVKKLCEESQKTTKGKKQRVPMTPLLIIREPLDFREISRDFTRLRASPFRLVKSKIWVSKMGNFCLT